MSDILLSQFVLFLLLFVRIGSMVMIAPVLGHEAVPPQVKIVLSLFLALIFYPFVFKMKQQIPLQLAPFVIAVFSEACIGMLMGFAAGIFFAGAQVAGDFLAFNMGLGFAQMFDPGMNQQVTVLSKFFYVIALLIFVVINGPHFLLQGLQLSYSYVPIGHFQLSESLYKEVITLSKTMFVVAVKISAPAVVALFLTNVVLAILARVVPQMNVFLVGFPLQIAVGLIVLFIISPLMVFVFKKLLLTFEDNFFELVKVL
ncbi:MAG: flagellar biosynthetic protein FliR [Ignavibacteria bacterium]|nr:flagellar biosynthetic protein FliR [Ignavibacteria bacterium]